MFHATMAPLRPRGGGAGASSAAAPAEGGASSRAAPAEGEAAPAEEHDPAEEGRERGMASPVTRAISLEYLGECLEVLEGEEPFSWTTRTEFLPPDHPHDVVTAETLEAHRAARRAAERQRNGEPREVRYQGIPLDALTTTDVVEMVVRPLALTTHLSYAEAKVPRRHVGPPTHFASHAWARPFRKLVQSLQTYFAGAVANEVFVWLDIFAINQDDGRAMPELDDGKTLERVIQQSAATLVVLDAEVFALSRLWCLYEIGSTPVHKLELLTPAGATSAMDMASHVDAETAIWCARPHARARLSPPPPPARPRPPASRSCR